YQGLVDVRYEELVANPQRVLRRIARLLDVQYDEQTGAHEAEAEVEASSELSPATPTVFVSVGGGADSSTRVVHTASRLQVKAPVNAKSVGRWRKYAAQLEESLLPLLRGELAVLAGEGALPFLGPDSSLLKQASEDVAEKGVEGVREGPVGAGPGAGQGRGGQQKKQKHLKHSKRRLKHDTHCVAMNWHLDQHFDYAGMLQQLR
ncbi:hypothetical protein B484DRAFT_410253, partial [Ochromonadaceae sp. CCMP2298]